MKKFKKAALTAASYVSVAALAIGGTVAYLDAQTDSISNISTIGDVEIEQIELERVNQTNSGKDALQEFTQSKLLIPSVGERDWVEGTNGRVYQEWESGGSSALYDAEKLANVNDKFVFVKNTGNADAYVRTIFAFEAGSLTAKQMNDDIMHLNVNSTHWEWTEFDDTMKAKIDDKDYFILEAVYTGNAGTDNKTHVNGVLGSGETTRPSLLQYDLDAKTTSEDLEAFGSTYEILVLSQAMQVTGEGAGVALDGAFGDVNADNAAKWFTGSVTTVKPASGAVRPAGHAPSVEGETIENLVIVDDSDEKTNLRALYKDGLKGSVTVSDSYLDGTYAMNLTVAKDFTGAVLTVENTDLRGWTSYSGFDSASFTDCTFDENSNPEIYKTIRPYDDTVFTNCDFAEGYEFWLDKLNGAKITLKNCTLDGVAITDATQLNIVYGDASSVVIK